MKFSSSLIATAFIIFPTADAFSLNANNRVHRPMSPMVSGPADSSTALGMGVRSFIRRKLGKNSGPATKEITKEEVRSLFNLWNNALATGDSRIVAKCYAKTSILLPTMRDQARTNYDAIKDYFDAFLLKQPQGKILDGEIRIGDGWAQDAGIYEVSYFMMLR